MRLPLSLLVPAALLLLSACPGADDDDDSDAGGFPRISTVFPEAGAEDVFYATRVRVRFDVAPTEASIRLSGPGGAEVPGAVEVQDSGRLFVFTPTANLAADGEHTATITWPSDESPASWTFTTGPYGRPLADPDRLVGQVFHLDLGSATILEPEAVGGLLTSFLQEVYVLFTLLPESDLDAGTAHMVGAAGAVEGGTIRQDLCVETLPYTFGPDGVPGTGDDTPAEWDNPDFALLDTDLTFAFRGSLTTIRDLNLRVVFHPELLGFAGGTLEAFVDTRDLLFLVDSEDEGAICELAEEAIGVSCIECGAPRAGAFCLRVRAEDIRGSAVPGELVDRSCADVIEDDLADRACEGEADKYRIDENDPGYGLCEDWPSPIGR